MELETLYRYLGLAEAGSVTRAARQAYLSRQTFADSMTRLEEELGVTLFVRQKKGLSLTPVGEELLRFLKAWLPEWEKECRTLENMEGETQTTIRIGVSFHRLTPVFIERMINYENLRGNVKVEYQDYSPGECFSLLEQNAIEVVCSLDSGERPGCDRVLLPETGVQPMLMMHETHPLAGKESITVADLAGVPMVLATNKKSPDPLLDRYATQCGAVPLYVPIRNDAYAFLLMKQRNAVGLTTVRLPNRFEQDGFVTRPLEDYPFDLSCYVYYKKDAPAAVKAFVAYFAR